MKHKIARFLSIFLVGWYRLRYSRHVHFGSGVIINHRFSFHGNGKLIIGDNVNLWAHEEPNRFFTYDKEAQITIGAGARFNGMTAHCQTRIDIGRKCMLASTILMDTDFHIFDDSSHVLYENPLSKPISIEDGAWLAGQSVILKGVTIGERSVVGFRAVVTKSCPSNVVVAGNPARVVKEKPLPPRA